MSTTSTEADPPGDLGPEGGGLLSRIGIRVFSRVEAISLRL